MKLRLKVLLYIILTTSIIFIASVGFINLRYWNYTKDLATRIANMYSKQSATTAQSILTADLKIAEALEQVFVSYKKFDEDVRTKFYRQILIDVLENNPNFLAVWLNWELSAVDPNWTLPYGRERTVAFLNMGTVDIRIDSTDLEGDVPGSYYYLIKSGVEENLITDPYFYTYTQDTGSTFLETSIATGIYNGKEFVGVVGIDISLQRFQKLLSRLKPYENSRVIMLSNDGTIVAYEDDKLLGKKINKVFPEYAKYKVIDKIKKGINFHFTSEKENGDFDYLSFYPIKLEGSTLPWSLGFIVSNSVIVKDLKSNSRLLIIISIISLVVISFIIWSVLSIIVSPIEKTAKTLEALSEGNVSDAYKIKYSTKDELGRMATAANILIDSLKRTQEFAKQIGKGNLDVKYDVLSKNDVLGKSLMEMRDNLLKASEEEKKRNEETARLSWTQNGITEINEILRQYSDSVEHLADELIKFLVNYTESVQGGFYLIEEHDEEKVISLKSTYAYDRKKEMEAHIEIGEGLVGRAVKEKQKIVIEDLPEGYLLVRSGLGDKSPNNLIVIPLIFEETVLGAIELAGFKKYDEFKENFLEQISIRITSSVSVLMKNIETANLLKESQLQTATFEMKEKQFIRQRKKLASKQKELEIKISEIDTSLNALKKFGLYLELDKKKNIIYSNDYLPKMFQIEKKELLEKSIDQITEFKKGSRIWIEKFWEDVIEKKQTRKKTTKYYWNDKIVEIKDIYFFIKEKDKEKIIIVGID